MKEIRIETIVKVYESYDSFSPTEQLLFEKAKKACDNAHAPYSKFHVGAAVLLENGLMFEGNNQENAAYPSGLCAERVALFYAMANYPNTAVKAIAITVDYENTDFEEIVSPCGGCRQVIAEYEHKFEQDIVLYLLAPKQKVCVLPSVSSILPLLFNGDILQAFNK